MAVDPISAGLGAASLISGKKANQNASSAAGAAGRRGAAMEKRLTALFDLLFSNAREADQSGQFDPEKRIAALERDTGRYESRDMGNLAGALATAGYRPGDSEIGTRLDAVKGKYRSFLDTMREQIRQSSFMEKQQAYLSANPNILQPAMANAANQQQIAMSQLQNPAGFLQAFLPTLRGGGQGRQAGFLIGGGANNSSGGTGQTRVRYAS